MKALTRSLVVAAGALAFVAIGAILYLAEAEHALHDRFLHGAEEARKLAGRHDRAAVTEEDLRAVPEPVARLVRASGALGKERISAVWLVHGGRFRPKADGPWMPIHGEYLVTTRRPSFHWYGKATMAPGVSIAALDSYLDGHGRMLVKAMSAIPIVDARSREIDVSAFGRCVVELSLAPTALLDRSLVRCAAAGPDSATCTVADDHFSTEAELSVHPDGALDRIAVKRYYDRGDGRSTLERFTVKGSAPRSFGGRVLPSRFDGSWNLSEGDLHYVSFDVESARFE
jgi:hypothetical protein